MNDLLCECSGFLHPTSFRFGNLAAEKTQKNRGANAIAAQKRDHAESAPETSLIVRAAQELDLIRWAAGRKGENAG